MARTMFQPCIPTTISVRVTVTDAMAIPFRRGISFLKTFGRTPPTPPANAGQYDGYWKWIIGSRPRLEALDVLR